MKKRKRFLTPLSISHWSLNSKSCSKTKGGFLSATVQKITALWKSISRFAYCEGSRLIRIPISLFAGLPLKAEHALVLGNVCPTPDKLMSCAMPCCFPVTFHLYCGFISLSSVSLFKITSIFYHVLRFSF